MAKIDITNFLAIDEDEIELSFIRAGGPGGQNVNKVATAVQLRFDVRNSPSLSGAVRMRLERLAGKRLTRDGVLVLTANRQRTQEANRRDALERLVELIREATVQRKRRIPTRMSRAAKQRRTDAKVRRGQVKKLRSGRVKADE